MRVIFRNFRFFAEVNRTCRHVSFFFFFKLVCVVCDAWTLKGQTSEALQLKSSWMEQNHLNEHLQWW